MLIKTTVVAALTGAVALTSFAGAACAQSRWGYAHPRQHEVLARVHRQEGTVRTDFRTGLISRGQAIRLMRDDRRVAHEDHMFARTNGGYITRGEQRFMNRQENFIGRRVY